MHSDTRVDQSFFIGTVPMGASSAYKGSTAEKNHEDNERFKPVVFHYLVAGFPKVPPDSSFSALHAAIAAFKLLCTA